MSLEKVNADIAFIVNEINALIDLKLKSENAEAEYLKLEQYYKAAFHNAQQVVKHNTECAEKYKKETKRLNEMPEKELQRLYNQHARLNSDKKYLYLWNVGHIHGAPIREYLLETEAPTMFQGKHSSIKTLWQHYHDTANYMSLRLAKRRLCHLQKVKQDLTENQQKFEDTISKYKLKEAELVAESLDHRSDTYATAGICTGEHNAFRTALLRKFDEFEESKKNEPQTFTDYTIPKTIIDARMSEDISTYRSRIRSRKLGLKRDALTNIETQKTMSTKDTTIDTVDSLFTSLSITKTSDAPTNTSSYRRHQLDRI